MKSAAVLAVLGPAVLSSATPLLGINTCDVVKLIVTQLQLAPSGTKFCSSFLSIQTVTSTSTSTVTPASVTANATATQTLPVSTITSTIIPDSITQTATVTQILSEVTQLVTATTNVTTTLTSTATTQSTASATAYTTNTAGTSLCPTASGNVYATTAQGPTGAQKRAVPTIPTPLFLIGQASSLISRECSCLGVPTPSTTTTVYRTLTPGTVTTTAIVTASPSTTVSTTLAPGNVTVTNTATESPTTVITTTTTMNFIESTTTTQTLDPTTSTTTIQVTRATPTNFNGLRYYEYTNTYNFDNANIQYNLADFQNPSYGQSGLIQRLSSLNSGSYCTLPGQSQSIDCRQITVVMQGFFYSPINATYYFNANNVDNLLAMYHGNTAYSGYNNNNADFIAVRKGNGGSGGPFSTTDGTSAARTTLHLQEGDYIPITLIYANGGGPGGVSFGANVVPDDGSPGSSIDGSGNFIPACDQGNPFSP